MPGPSRPKLVVDDPFGTLPLRKHGRRIHRFTKAMNPGELVPEFQNLGVRFHLPIDHSGMAAMESVFETDDQMLADEIRRVAKARPTLYVVESA